MKKILITGVGSIGERHARCFFATGRAQVVICDTNTTLAREVGTRYRMTVATDFEGELASRRYDGVIICTPAHLHVAMALRVLEAKCSVLIEKPLSVRMDGVDQLLEYARKTERFAAVAYVYHFIPVLQKGREILRQGRLGQVWHVAVISGQHFPTFRPAYRQTYYTHHETGGGAIQDALTHLVNAVEWLVGPTTAITCEAAHQMLEGVDVEDTVSVSARNGKVLVTYAMNQFQRPNETEIHIHGENGSLRMEFHRERFGVWYEGNTDWQWESVPSGGRDGVFTAQANAFLDGIEGKPNGLCSLKEAIQVLRVNLAALESARVGKRIVL